MICVYLAIAIKVPKKQPKRGRLWLNDGSCVRLRPLHKDHVWTYDFVHGKTHDGRPFRMLTLIDEYARECLMLKVARNFKAADVVDALNEVFLLRDARAYPQAGARQALFVKSYALIIGRNNVGGDSPPGQSLGEWFYKEL